MSKAQQPPRFRVILAQMCLQGIGFYHGLADGIYGPDTRQAVQGFQGVVRHLEPTGDLDDNTWGALAQAGEIALEVREDGLSAPEGVWPGLPDELLVRFDELADLCVAQEVSYGPGRGWYDVEEDGFIVTQGPFGLKSARFKTRDKERRPAFVCSTFTYFVAAYLLRVGPVFKEALAGGQPPIWDVLMGAPRVHTGTGFGPWMGFGGAFRPVLSDGSTSDRVGRARWPTNRLDLQEVWERRHVLPELMLGGWASRERGFIHHTAALRYDADTDELRFVDAGGWRSKDRVFSGTDMDIQRISSQQEAVAAGRKGWGRWYGFWPGDELLTALAQKAPRLGFEVEPGVVQWLGGGCHD